MADPRGARSAAPVTVLLVDDHAIWRGGVRSMLEGTVFRIIGEAASGVEAARLVSDLRPRLVLLDIRMAGGDGLDALQAIKRAAPGSAIVMLTTYDNPTFVARAVAGGAAGYLLKGVERHDLIDALRRVADGETLLTRQDLVRALRLAGEAALQTEELADPLTDREVQVLRLLATGLNNRDIATVLFVAESTIKTHVEHIIGKLGVSDRVQAAVWAARQGLTRGTP